MKLHFTIDKTTLNREDDEIITSYSKNTNKCIFCCDCKWSDIYKYALFTDVYGGQYIVDLGFGQKVACLIPEEVLKNNFFLVSVFGDNRYTTTQETIFIQPSGFTDKTEISINNGESTVAGQSSLNDLDIHRFNNCHCRSHFYYDAEHLYY